MINEITGNRLLVLTSEHGSYLLVAESQKSCIDTLLNDHGVFGRWTKALAEDCQECDLPIPICAAIWCVNLEQCDTKRLQAILDSTPFFEVPHLEQDVKYSIFAYSKYSPPIGYLLNGTYYENTKETPMGNLEDRNFYYGLSTSQDSPDNAKPFGYLEGHYIVRSDGYRFPLKKAE